MTKKIVFAFLLSLVLIGCNNKKPCHCYTSCGTSPRNIVIITGPSGSGKTTAGEKLAAEFNIARSISATSREQRKGEIDGSDYYFKTRQEMEQMIKNDEMIEYSYHFGNIYGVPKSNLEKLKKQDLIFIVDYNGAQKISKLAKEKSKKRVIKIYIDISPKAALERIKKRGDKISQENLKKRLARAEKPDLSTYFVVDSSSLTKEQVYEKVKEIYNENK